MYKKITHFDKQIAQYKPDTARYFFREKILLEVEDANMTHCVFEKINILGIKYEVKAIVAYPELMLTEYHVR